MGGLYMYKSINDIPEHKRGLFERLIRNGIIVKDNLGNINISHDLYEMILILARLGLI